MAATHSAVIFDVDGPLLDLLPAEEEAFFAPFRILHGLTGLSNDWDSYRTRNDEDIIVEILETHFGRAPDAAEVGAITAKYAEVLDAGYASGDLQVAAIPGALALLQALSDTGGIALGTATANVLHAARTRLEHAGLWEFVRHHPGAADGGGAKSEVLARVIDGLDVPRERIVFIGDNLNDLEAGRVNDVQFVGFHVAEDRRRRLLDHGAGIVFGDHRQTHEYIIGLLGR